MTVFGAAGEMSLAGGGGELKVGSMGNGFGEDGVRAGTYGGGGGGWGLTYSFFPVGGPSVAIFQVADDAILGCFLPVDAVVFGPDGDTFVARVGDGIAGFFVGAELCEVGLLAEGFENVGGFAGTYDERLTEASELLVEFVEGFLNELPVEGVEIGGVDDVGFNDV